MLNTYARRFTAVAFAASLNGESQLKRCTGSITTDIHVYKFTLHVSNKIFTPCSGDARAQFYQPNQWNERPTPQSPVIGLSHLHMEREKRAGGKSFN